MIILKTRFLSKIQQIGIVIHIKTIADIFARKGIALWVR
jgi:hypothetical protein